MRADWVKTHVSTFSSVVTEQYTHIAGFTNTIALALKVTIAAKGTYCGDILRKETYKADGV